MFPETLLRVWSPVGLILQDFLDLGGTILAALAATLGPGEVRGGVGEFQGGLGEFLGGGSQSAPNMDQKGMQNSSRHVLSSIFRAQV